MFKKLLLCSALCVTMIGQTVSISAETKTTPIACTDGMSGYILYVYEDGSGTELGKMYLRKSGSTAINTFTNSYKCAPRVAVGTDESFWNYSGSTYTYKYSGDTTTAKKTGTASSYAYGYVQVVYD